MASQTTKTNKETVRRIYEESINHNDLRLLDQLVSKEFVGPRGERGPAGFRASVETLRTGLPDLQFKLEEILAEEDHVAVRWTSSGTHTGTLRGIPPTGKSVEDSGIAFFQLRDARVVSMALQTDRLGFLQQIGAVPTDLSQLRAPGHE
jgi:steroid delta-isomerase-like uncharacterized protein